MNQTSYGNSPNYDQQKGYFLDRTCGSLNGSQDTSQISQERVFNNPNVMKKMPVYGGNWARNKYDQGTLEIDTRQATASIEYHLDPVYAERCNICRPAGPGWVSKQGVSYDNTKALVDTESDLFNLNRVLSRDPSYKFIPYCPQCQNCPSGLPCGDGVVDNCENCQAKLFHFPSCDLSYEYTRISNPKCTLRETGVNRFQPICLNPQDMDRWQHPGEIGINYRLIAKDNHFVCPPSLIDQTPALPTGGSIPCNLVIPTCSAPIQPLHNYYK